ncbi:predicted protein [Chaetomium globosum CBS 148.51]|uniref:Uncharacterized protein n=1 Tax=Chaetomium globosum (strain ATCC 6205 / CBS 148.51 / DSM 1962 / NBRC 6347 / NRRL 1970) TaxID=306901 RepID=Q2GPM8_CHAGB|nr:uncharacterized protein CHGG_10076 [Chaetomium globosum CBS 148.51]EAQ83672.1 predicted protein [Chaetomium globosum CBS 148.51]
MAFVDIWVAVLTLIGSITSSLIALPVLGDVLRWFGLRPLPPHDRVPELLVEVRDDQSGLVVGPTTIIGGQQGLVGGQDTIGGDLRALIDAAQSLDKNLMVAVENQKAILEVIMAITDEIEKFGDDLNSRFDNVRDVLDAIVRVTESSTEALGQMSALVAAVSGRRMAQSEPASTATQTQGTEVLKGRKGSYGATVLAACVNTAETQQLHPSILRGGGWCL